MGNPNTSRGTRTWERVSQAIPILGIVAVGALAVPPDAAAAEQPAGQHPHIGTAVHAQHGGGQLHIGGAVHTVSDARINLNPARPAE